MTRDEYAGRIRQNLREHLETHPAAEDRDIVKFVFQGFLGPGHLLRDPETTEERIAIETREEEPAAVEPLTEDAGPSWCRLNLRRAAAEKLSPRMIARMMHSPHPDGGFTRTDVELLCRRIAEEESKPGMDGALIPLQDENRLPSHSDAYRRTYRPSYRLVSAEWLELMPALCETAKRLSRPGSVLVTVDGPCASGKTTLAEKAAHVLECRVVHTDDFVVPHARKTPERLSVPGGNCDWERLVREVLLPWKQGSAARFRRYDCHRDIFLPEETLEPGKLLILEGSYSNLPAIRALADIRIFMNTPEEIRMKRLKQRETPESLIRFRKRWIPLENAYFAAYGLPDGECITVPDTGTSGRHQ